MDAVQIHNVVIHCDTCDHEFQGDLASWLGKECPQCGAPDIINHIDVAYFNAIRALADLANSTIGGIQDDAEMVSVRFNSAPLR